VLQEAGESEEGKIVKNENGGCDLKNLFDKTIGESVISARAVYPYEPVDYSAQTSEETLTKTVVSKWEKEWFEFSKGNGSNEANVKVVVAKAQDIDGYPITDEKVCFHVEQGAALKSYNGISGYVKDPTEQLGKGSSVYVGGSWVDGGQEGTTYLCVTTNQEGLATVEVEDSSSGKVDLIATYEEEHVYRDHFVLFPGNAGGLKEAEEAKKEEEALQKAHEAEEAATKKANEERQAAEAAKVQAEEAAAKKANEEKAAAAKSAEEKAAIEAKSHAEEAAAKKANEEKLAAAKAAREAEEAATKKKHEEEVANLAKPSEVTSVSAVTSAVTPVSASAPVTAVKPLTNAQKLANALKACRKLSRKKRVACEAQVRHVYAAKHKKGKK
jgi:chemotaxis protein histidine kinase CheA